MTKAPRLVRSLELLLHPLSLEEFVRKHWPDHPYIAHGPLERLEPLMDVARDQDETVAELLLSPDLRGVNVQVTRDEQTLQLPVSEPSVAQDAYEKGAQLYFRLDPTGEGPFQGFFAGLKA